jgi:hypothetical protein
MLLCMTNYTQLMRFDVAHLFPFNSNKSIKISVTQTPNGKYVLNLNQDILGQPSDLYTTPSGFSLTEIFRVDLVKGYEIVH